MKYNTYKTENMTCGNCANKILKKLRSLDGIKDAQVDMFKGLIDIEFDETTITEEEFKKAVEEIGYGLI
jgi:copper chaperone CopZ